MGICCSSSDPVPEEQTVPGTQVKPLSQEPDHTLNESNPLISTSPHQGNQIIQFAVDAQSNINLDLTQPNISDNEEINSPTSAINFANEPVPVSNSSEHLPTVSFASAMRSTSFVTSCLIKADPDFQNAVSWMNMHSTTPTINLNNPSTIPPQSHHKVYQQTYQSFINQVAQLQAKVNESRVEPSETQLPNEHMDDETIRKTLFTNWCTVSSEDRHIMNEGAMMLSDSEPDSDSSHGRKSPSSQLNTQRETLLHHPTPKVERPKRKNKHKISSVGQSTIDHKHNRRKGKQTTDAMQIIGIEESWKVESSSKRKKQQPSQASNHSNREEDKRGLKQTQTSIVAPLDLPPVTLTKPSHGRVVRVKKTKGRMVSDDEDTAHSEPADLRHRSPSLSSRESSSSMSSLLSYASPKSPHSFNRSNNSRRLSSTLSDGKSLSEYYQLRKFDEQEELSKSNRGHPSH
ncbi:hypothetical protein BLNAU_70 [Blattamonas nauphoetae]|uniref:Uncharacterized protein n=1 Tax=Blattamonas nauphoetae TaxID=2049346 RepID=A0ABQ9YLX6_9EUKA|nr:hypothetical protein BLNAU_70 [Blattamonas nauphoetae]